MGNAVGQMLASAVGIAISPVPLIAVVLMLATPRGRGNGSAFALGWVTAVGLVTALIVAFGGGMQTGGEPADWTYWLKLGLGVLFLLLAAEQWQGRPRAGQEAAVPGWMEAVDTFTPGKAAGLAVALVVANPKNLVLLVGGAVSIASSGASGGGKALGVVLMVVIASLCVTVPLAVYLFGGERAAGVLSGWKTWMAAHNSAIMIVLLLVLGAKYVGDALSGLSG
ncbi:GAP family protein [Streptacidiphilus jiangxiensis]|uniref:Sap, sulfolipid-1-addressing protein n=1 Tax=Streptacidiphilus jiangxiensis TaxID=235985 RepID=A0A1H7HSM9_STRJI|nr:GAP family protein [Streptacidiphilus jiangxiensis]SEK53178.1 Sap, sulfolipid-1-addressing protein [Streptacidiphilus jiangxiensis]